MIKKILHFIIEPFRFVGSRDLTNKIVSFFDRHSWLIYVLAFFIALIAVFIKYIYPTFI